MTDFPYCTYTLMPSCAARGETGSKKPQRGKKTPSDESAEKQNRRKLENNFESSSEPIFRNIEFPKLF